MTFSDQLLILITRSCVEILFLTSKWIFDFWTEWLCQSKFREFLESWVCIESKNGFHRIDLLVPYFVEVFNHKYKVSIFSMVGTYSTVITLQTYHDTITRLSRHYFHTVTALFPHCLGTFFTLSRHYHHTYHGIDTTLSWQILPLCYPAITRYYYTVTKKLLITFPPH